MIHIYEDAETMSRAFAGRFAAWAAESIGANGRFGVALSGGDTPRRAYELLSEEPFRGGIDWARVHVFWGDERCVPPGDDRSNERMARLAFLDRVPIPPEQIHPIRCYGSPREAAERYEKTLREYLGDGPRGLDLVMLGLGTNGHTASLFPGSPVLREKERWAAAADAEGEDFARVTMTAPFINNARRVIFLVSGKAKAAILKKALEGEKGSPKFPAQLIRPESGELGWVVDRNAAGLLIEREGLGNG